MFAFVRILTRSIHNSDKHQSLITRLHRSNFYNLLKIFTVTEIDSFSDGHALLSVNFACKEDHVNHVLQIDNSPRIVSERILSNCL